MTIRHPVAAAAFFMGASLLGASGAMADTVVLFDQDFEAPSGFVNGSGSGYDDLSQQQVNDLYGNQPPGFTFSQRATVETLKLDGTEAFGTGYSDPAGTGGSYALGMQQRIEDDRLSLTFDTGAFDFFNLSFDLSNIGISGGIGSPFAEPQSMPQIDLAVFSGGYDLRQIYYNSNLSVLRSVAPTPLDTGQLIGTASDLSVLDWTNGQFAFDISDKTSSLVTLQFDLVTTGYVALDNFRITASDDPFGGLDPNDPPAVPLPAGGLLLLSGLAALGARRLRR